MTQQLQDNESDMEGKDMDHYNCFIEEFMFMAMSLSLRLMTETNVRCSRVKHERMKMNKHTPKIKREINTVVAVVLFMIPCQ
jgi:hypothetical protein